jgi:hypothetical protein
MHLASELDQFTGPGHYTELLGGKRREIVVEPIRKSIPTRPQTTVVQLCEVTPEMVDAVFESLKSVAASNVRKHTQLRKRGY